MEFQDKADNNQLTVKHQTPATGSELAEELTERHKART